MVARAYQTSNLFSAQSAKLALELLAWELGTPDDKDSLSWTPIHTKCSTKYIPRAHGKTFITCSISYIIYHLTYKDSVSWS